jgi:general secretion pathway protein A
MYHQFFGLSKDPFSMTPDPAFLFLTSAHREALAGLTYSVLSRKGFVVLTGDAGTGKTTLLTKIFQSIPPSRARFSVVLNPILTPAEFLELALLDFGVTNIPDSKTQRLNLLQQFLIDAHKKGQVAVLVVDEAHKLPPDVLEEIRLLSNFELADTKLLQIVLAGQTELGDVLNRQDMRQLKQRIAMRLTIHPLSPIGVEHYITHRWQKAGGKEPHPFQPEAVERIAYHARGIPRLVNALCDNALMLAYAQGHKSVGTAHLAEVVKDLDLLDTPGRPIRAALPPRAPASPRPAGLRPMVRTAPREQSASSAMNGQTNGSGKPPTVPSLEAIAASDVKPSRFMRLVGILGFSSRPPKQTESDI